MKKLASNTKTAVTLFVTLNIFSFVPFFVASLITSWLTSNVLVYILINCLLVTPIPYYTLKWSAKSVSNTYVIKDNKEVISLVKKYLLVFNSIFLVGNSLYVGYISASMIVGAFTVGWMYYVIQSRGLSLVANSPENEIFSSAEDKASIKKSIGKAALFAVAIFTTFLLVPLIGLILYGDVLGNKLGYVAVTYFVAMFVAGVYIYKKLFPKVG